MNAQSENVPVDSESQMTEDETIDFLTTNLQIPADSVQALIKESLEAAKKVAASRADGAGSASVKKDKYTFERNGGTTREWAEYAYNRGHDGVIFRNIEDEGPNGDDMGFGEGDVYVVFNSNQAKDIYNDNPTDNADIRYSFSSEDELYDYYASLEGSETAHVVNTAEAKRVRVQTHEELYARIEKLKADKRLTHGKVLDQAKARGKVNELIKTLMQFNDYKGRKIDNRLAKNVLDDVSRMYAHFKSDDTESCVNLAMQTAQDIVDNVQFIDDANWEYYKDLRDYLNSVQIRIS